MIQLVRQSNPHWVLLKTDAKNAFNSVSRKTILDNVRDSFPELLSFVSKCYVQPSTLLTTVGDTLSAISSEEGVHTHTHKHTQTQTHFPNLPDYVLDSSHQDATNAIFWWTTLLRRIRVPMSVLPRAPRSSSLITDNLGKESFVLLHFSDINLEDMYSFFLFGVTDESVTHSIEKCVCVCVYHATLDKKNYSPSSIIRTQCFGRGSENQNFG